jgi:hypothetical protein
LYTKHFNQPLVKADWHRVALYAPRIGSISFRFRGRKINASVFCAIENAITEGMHPFPLLSRLQSIVFDEGSMPPWQLQSFLTTVIKSLEINTDYRWQKMVEERRGLQTVLASLPKRCPAIQDLTVTCNRAGIWDDIVLPFSQGLHEMQALTTLCISPHLIPFSTLREISLAPKLQELTFEIDGLAVNDIPPELHFPCLIQCTIHGEETETAMKFIKSLKSPSLTALHALLQSSLSADDIHQILTFLLPFAFTFRAITIDWGFFPENGDDPTNQHQITASTLAPLLCFANIEIFRLNVDASF